jgi:hypothetical protein
MRIRRLWNLIYDAAALERTEAYPKLQNVKRLAARLWESEHWERLWLSMAKI